VPGVGGKGFDVPDIPKMHTGGVVQQAGMAIIKPDEEAVSLPSGATVVPLPRGTVGDVLGGGGGPIIIQVTLDGKVISEAVYDNTRDKVARR
jgi:hypothetical protein